MKQLMAKTNSNSIDTCLPYFPCNVVFVFIVPPGLQKNIFNKLESKNHGVIATGFLMDYLGSYCF